MPEFDATAEYRDIPGFPDFRVGTDGSVWSRRGRSFKSIWHCKVWIRLKPATARGGGKPRGYPRVNLYSNNQRHHRLVHQIVLEVFVGPRPDGMEACHNDGDSMNNRLDNLRWGTRASNSADTRKHGRHWTPFRGPPSYRKAWASKAESQEALLKQAGY